MTATGNPSFEVRNEPVPLGTTNYLYDGIDYGSNAIEEVDNVGNVLARYTQSPAVDQPLAEVRSATTTYYQQDALSSVTSLGSPAGALANTYTFDSFGKLTASTGTLTNPFQYSGREFDAESGLFYNRHRFYDPSLGRFISEDPSGFDGGINFYGYVKNNPVIWIDPSGLVRCTYNISTHQLHCLSDDLTQSFDTDRARSGRGLCRNDRACQNRSNQGPIPEGEYYMGQIGDTPNRHPVPRVPLTAFAGSLAFDLDRGNFQVHQGNDSSSSGCIVLDPAEYQRFLHFYARDNSGVMGVQ
jgi:RHS repeat-associated protein